MDTKVYVLLKTIKFICISLHNISVYYLYTITAIDKLSYLYFSYSIYYLVLKNINFFNFLIDKTLFYAFCLHFRFNLQYIMKFVEIRTSV